MTLTAIISGRGALPGAIYHAMVEKPLVCAMEGFLPDGITVDQAFRVERLAPFLRYLQDREVSRVCFAGAVQRPRLDPSLFDPATATMVPRLLAALQAGDDATLREVLAIFQEHGFEIVGAADLVPDLVPKAGVYAGTLSDMAKKDATRAALIVQALGAVDVGQGAVVVQGLCLAVEALPGTDAMLDGLMRLDPALLPNRASGGGIFYKAAKPGQDLRIDMPTLGVDTINKAALAGLDGIVWAAGCVLCLDFSAMVTAANAKGLLLWAREA